jgi:hypothetical protein
MYEKKMIYYEKLILEKEKKKKIKDRDIEEFTNIINNKECIRLCYTTMKNRNLIILLYGEIDEIILVIYHISTNTLVSCPYTYFSISEMLIDCGFNIFERFRINKYFKEKEWLMKNLEN